MHSRPAPQLPAPHAPHAVTSRLQLPRRGQHHPRPPRNPTSPPASPQLTRDRHRGPQHSDGARSPQHRPLPATPAQGEAPHAAVPCPVRPPRPQPPRSTPRAPPRPSGPPYPLPWFCPNSPAVPQGTPPLHPPRRGRCTDLEAPRHLPERRRERAAGRGGVPGRGWGPAGCRGRPLGRCGAASRGRSAAAAPPGPGRRGAGRGRRHLVPAAPIGRCGVRRAAVGGLAFPSCCPQPSRGISPD